MADVILTSCNVARSWHWFRHMTAPCNVACGSGIVTVNSPSGSTLQCDTWYVVLRWHTIEFAKRPPYWNSTPRFDFDQSTCNSAPVCEILSKSDHPQQKKMTSCRFSRWRISAILDFRDPIMGSLESPITTSSVINRQHSSKLLSFEKIAFFAFWRQTDRQTNGRTDGQHRCTKPLSLSRAAA